ncbi:MAG: hypothetical protein JRG71_01900 [Deltaproteobacteria bacterium]|nr:hypothetical protein [Deltaproteobacteria bacterium]
MCSVEFHTRSQTVSTDAKTANTIIIAIPSYGDRIFPRFDQAHEFNFAEINLKKRSIETMTTHLCPAQENDMCCWLHKMSVKGVICSGIHHHHQVKFQQIGIWLVWGMSGNIKSTLQQWLKDQPAMVNKNQHIGFDQTKMLACNETPSM